MSKRALEAIKNAMNTLDINYSFMEWNDEPVYPYFTGEYQEFEPYDEDGMQEISFLLTGFSRGSWETLEDAKEKIENHFNKVSGDIVNAEGWALAIFYANSLVIPTGDAELKKIQINLSIKEWKV